MSANVKKNIIWNVPRVMTSLLISQHSNSRDVVAGSLSFSRPIARTPQRACSQATFWTGFLSGNDALNIEGVSIGHVCFFVCKMTWIGGYEKWSTHAGGHKWPWTSENQATHAADVRGSFLPTHKCLLSWEHQCSFLLLGQSWLYLPILGRLTLTAEGDNIWQYKPPTNPLPPLLTPPNWLLWYTMYL